ncbi:hypothetical protein EGI16_01865 [Chryseobacterium sp. G0240]|uniref:hypothetical protein n=1 Tax=Chryseobacterium sp. G0240 TaxID=2487066 RepID=UPI000F457581|nr:hypothetical protein [Chryseobacterium sp. G0240]ROI06676.1 hypothetical protein EGI16_01865 [Chryseobacterium sp. G0240]
MNLRRVVHSETKGFSHPSIGYDEAVEIFKNLNWYDENTFYNQEFGDSYIQFKALKKGDIIGDKELKVEILLDENMIKFAASTVSIQEALDLIKYYFEHDEIGEISSYHIEYI